MNLIFLAAAIPPKDKFGPTDRIAVRDSVLALVSQLEPEDELCFGGHPAITPFVITAAKSLNVLKQITIYQAHWFFEEVPPLHYEIARFIWDDRKKWPPGTRPSVETPDGVRERNESLKAMRIKMLSDNRPYTAGFFIGGKEGVVEEWDVFAHNHPSALLFPLGSTGGAAEHLWSERRKQIYDCWMNNVPLGTDGYEKLERLYYDLGNKYLYRSLISELLTLSSNPDRRPNRR